MTEKAIIVSPSLPGDSTQITSDDQRKECVREMRKNYRSYKKLHSRVKAVTNQFSAFEVQLKNTQKNTPKYKAVADKVRKLYKKTKKDMGYQNAKKEFNDLHPKLMKMMRSVKEYDNGVKLVAEAGQFKCRL